MPRTLPLDALDSRVVLLGYAAVVIPAGVFVTLWGGLFVNGPLNGHPHGIQSLVRIAGTLAVAAGITAVALSQFAAATERRRGLGWFAVAHTVVLLMAWSQAHTVWGDAASREVRLVFTGVLMAWAWLFLGWTRQGGDVQPLGRYLGLFGDKPATPTHVLRSQYELQMRQAGAQEERHRLARDLHDSVKQQLFAIQTAAATVEARFSTDPAGARNAIAQVRHAARDSMAEMDAMLDQLRATPLENIGLVGALKQQCEALRLRTGAEVVCEIGSLPPNDALQPGVHLALFRAAQESLSNVARHARASSVHVKLDCSGNRLTLTMTDNGSGYEPDIVKNGMGLRNIRERAEEFGGDAHIATKPGAGTTVLVSVPFLKGEPTYFLRKALWSVAWLAVGTVLVSSSRSRTWLLPAFLIVPFTLDAVRYFLAWRRSRTLRERAA